MLNLEDYKLDCLPDTCYYIPNFITEAEEKLLLHEIYKTPVNWLNFCDFLRIH